MSALFPASRLTCERCHGHGHVTSAAGRLACLNCSAAANDTSPWTPASQPPAHEPNPSRSDYIECVGIVAPESEDGIRLAEVVLYWPLRKRWTMSKPVGGCWDDVEVNVTHYFEIPELPQEVA